MIAREACMDIWSLKRQGYGLREIGRKVGVDWRTVKKYLENKGMPEYRQSKRGSKLEPYYPMIHGWLQAENYLATRIHELLIAQGYLGSYEVVKRYVGRLKEERDRVAYVRFETMPGQQAQVDFGEFMVVLPDGSEKKLYCFVMALGFSRHMYVELVERCTMTVFLDCHIHAFGYFGGVPGEIIYDNMKNVVIRHLVGKVTFNETILDFAMHYQYKPVACPPYSPWCKGKVERPIDYIRERFWRGYVYHGLEACNEDLIVWLDTVAMERVHGTTRQKVFERFESERPRLGSLPQRVYDTSAKYVRKVYKDCQLSFDGNRYVVAHRCVGKKVLVKAKDGKMRVFLDEELIAVYVLGIGKGAVLAHPWFYDALRRDKEQLRKKYRMPYGKGKATIGLVSENNYRIDVQVRDLSVYEQAAGGETCLN
jgi:transposase